MLLIGVETYYLFIFGMEYNFDMFGRRLLEQDPKCKFGVLIPAYLSGDVEYHT